ncbi:MAG: hypothetical protein HC923_10380 [Myxococcales bacterium]|nr:hypothetical protein [Myxococcales bacterium]
MRARIRDIVPRFEAILVDAFGVLIDDSGAVPRAAEFLDWLRARKTPFLVVTNDCSRLPETVAARLQAQGITVSEEDILTSGGLIGPHLDAEGVAEGAACVVLGPEDSFEYVRRARREPIDFREMHRFDALIVGDDSGYPLLEAVDALISPLVEACLRGEPPALVLPNPDVRLPPEGARPPRARERRHRRDLRAWPPALRGRPQPPATGRALPRDPPGR